MGQSALLEFRSVGTDGRDKMDVDGDTGVKGMDHWCTAEVGDESGLCDDDARKESEWDGEGDGEDGLGDEDEDESQGELRDGAVARYLSQVQARLKVETDNGQKTPECYVKGSFWVRPKDAYFAQVVTPNSSGESL